MNNIINDWKPELRSVLEAIRRHGFTVRLASNGEYVVGAEKGDAALLACLDACDEAHLVCDKDGHHASFFLVLGNCPGEIIADVGHSPELSDVVDTIIEEHGNAWEGRKQPTKRWRRHG